MEPFIVTPDEVEMVLKSLPLGKASGPDSVNNKILKELSTGLSLPLADLFNYSLTTSTFPDAWKEAYVSPVFKNGDRSLPGNYRPISLLSTIEYGDIIFDNCTVQEKDLLEKVQYEAARIVTGATKLVSLHKLMQEVGWESLEKDDWGSCLQSKDESKIKELLQENIIPNSNHLNDAYRIFEPSSEILEGIFALASEHIKNQSSHILRVYAAYHDRMISDSSYCFLVFTKQSAAIQVHLNVKNVEYPIKIVYIEDCSQEDEDVVEASLKRYSQLVYVGQVEISISEHSERLMKETKNITLITTSMYKSRNYQRGKPLNLVEGPCIVILVMLKNWIPIGSKPLPKKINGISVDVREGIAVQFTGKLPTEKHENVRIGCKIESSVFPGSGNSLDVYNQGTLGGFILDKNSSIYGFTCAHILFPDEVLRQMQNDDQLYVGNDLGLTVEKMPGEMISNLNKIVNCPDKRKVYQASCEENEYLGTVEMALYARGGTFDFTGVDFAVVKIDEKRIPNTTKFPYFDDSITFNREMEGASAEREFHFKSGKVIEEDLKSGEKVIKYGCKTQLTEGYFQRKCTFNFIDGEKWHGQCEIIAQRGFAKPSDSGSLVFKPKDGDLEAACILLGGTTTRFAATHFADVLERTGLKDVKFLKFGDPKANEDSM
ncbi:uncharacterized protein LOC128557930 [Mercenaria mercenaria]|uniref:uncharacterized protein LOC128557930 n=1 Tax=Mercenaria mercenaria TaxID=6596 RepID=UPI00234E421D|nr:uncharacterized protein LOC128557930 [Mercenaria mercenaria]